MLLFLFIHEFLLENHGATVSFTPAFCCTESKSATFSSLKKNASHLSATSPLPGPPPPPPPLCSPHAPQVRILAVSCFICEKETPDNRNRLNSLGLTGMAGSQSLG